MLAALHWVTVLKAWGRTPIETAIEHKQAKVAASGAVG